MKKLIILKHGGGELANQLWNYLSIYAYGLEIGAPVRNPSFYEYHYFFRFLDNESWVTRFNSLLLFRTPRRRTNWINKNQRLKYAQRAWITAKFNSARIYSSENTENKAVYLPPTAPLPTRFETCDKLYFTGWLFRNPKGLEKYATELRQAFTPKQEVLKKIDDMLSPLRVQYEKVVGIHIRQADYAHFKDGAYFISQSRVREIINEYIQKYSLSQNKTIFIIASDGKIDENIFRGLNILVSKEHAVTDLFLLSKTDVILGSDSSFGAFAAWYGNIRHFIFKKEVMDFNNNYSLLTAK
jgi:hypothetical protein